MDDLLALVEDESGHVLLGLVAGNRAKDDLRQLLVVSALNHKSDLHHHLPRFRGHEVNGLLSGPGAFVDVLGGSK